MHFWLTLFLLALKSIVGHVIKVSEKIDFEDGWRIENMYSYLHNKPPLGLFMKQNRVTLSAHYSPLKIVACRKHMDLSNEVLWAKLPGIKV